jgi:DNA-binding SARP family transcriptional activator
MALEFRILGPLEVRDGDRGLVVRGEKQRLLLARLLLSANRVVSTDRLVEAIWGDAPPDTPDKALQMHVSQLRKLLEPERAPGRSGHVLVTQPPGYVLHVDEGRLDLVRFERAVAAAAAATRAGGHAEAARGLRDALGLWRGAALADLGAADGLRADLARLDDLRLGALEDRIDADLALGRHARVVAELERLVAEHPLRERVRAQLMLALYRSGRQAEALAVYRDTRRALVEELGIEPGRALRELERRILAQDPGLDYATPEVAAATPRSRAATEGLVGRRRELSELLPVVDGALAGGGAVVLIGGEPGIGKSRLAETLARHAHERGARVAVGRCWEAGGAPAYWPWLQALRSYARETDPERLRSQLGADGPELTAILPELTELVPGLPAAPAGGPEGARFRLFSAVAAFLRRAATAAPLALFLDDLHAADPPSLVLLRYMAAELAGAPILVVGCYRDTETGPGAPLADTLPDLVREAAVHRATLGGLDAIDTARLLEQVSGRPPASELAARVHAQTEGNPLFAGEIGRLLATTDGAGGDEDQRLPIPAGVRETIGRRLQRQSPECNDVLALASVLGREFGLDVLEHVTGLEPARLYAAVEEAIAARLVDPVPRAAGRLRFAHVMIRDTLYEGLPATRRPLLHRDVADALERLHEGNVEPHVAELAHHYLEAGFAAQESALRYAIRAGDRAASQLAHEDAAGHYRTALALLEASRAADPGTTAEVLLSLGDVLSRAGSDVEAKDAYRRAAEIARRHGQADRLARAAEGYGGRFLWPRAGTDAALVPLLETALAALGDGDSSARVRLLSRLSTALRDEPARERRARLAGEAVAIARRLGDTPTLAYALDAHWVAVEGPYDVEERMSRADELLELAQRIGDYERELEARDFRASTFWMLGDRAGVDVEFDAMNRLADALRQPAQRWLVSGYDVMFALLEGRLDEAEHLIAATLELGRRAHPWNAVKSHRFQLYVLRREQGRLAEIEETFRRVVHEYPDQQAFRCMLAHVYAEAGREREARAALAALLERDLSRTHVDEEWLLGLSVLADVCAYLRDAGSAARLYVLLLPFRRLNALATLEVAVGAVARPLGVLATTTGRFDDAEAHFQAAIEMERRMGARPGVAHAQHGLAAMLLARGAPGDRDRARALVRATVGAYEELGMGVWAARCAGLERGRSVAPRSG